MWKSIGVATGIWLPLLAALMAVFPLGGGFAAELRRVPPAFVPRLRVRGAERPVRLQSLAIHVSIAGGIAETSLDMTFFNPNARVLEGELQFPLLPGQEVSGLALDIAGEMRHGVPVPKARGQEVFRGHRPPWRRPGPA